MFSISKIVFYTSHNGRYFSSQIFLSANPFNLE